MPSPLLLKGHSSEFLAAHNAGYGGPSGVVSPPETTPVMHYCNYLAYSVLAGGNAVGVRFSNLELEPLTPRKTSDVDALDDSGIFCPASAD